MVGYYDAVLGLIPVSLFGLGGLLTGAGLPFTTAVPIATLVAGALVCHAMFVRTPGGALGETFGEPVDTPAESSREFPAD
jgi:hypothetical protein